MREESQRLVFGDRARARSRKRFEKGKDVKCKRIKSFSVISTNRNAGAQYNYLVVSYRIFSRYTIVRYGIMQMSKSIKV